MKSRVCKTTSFVNGFSVMTPASQIIRTNFVSSGIRLFSTWCGLCSRGLLSIDSNRGRFKGAGEVKALPLFPKKFPQ